MSLVQRGLLIAAQNAVFVREEIKGFSWRVVSGKLAFSNPNRIPGLFEHRLLS